MKTIKPGTVIKIRYLKGAHIVLVGDFEKTFLDTGVNRMLIATTYLPGYSGLISWEDIKNGAPLVYTIPETPVAVHLTRCPHPKCSELISPGLYACKFHWLKISPPLREMIVRGFKEDLALWVATDKVIKEIWGDDK
jgi:hypothetical protein